MVTNYLSRGGLVAVPEDVRLHHVEAAVLGLLYQIRPHLHARRSKQARKRGESDTLHELRRRTPSEPAFPAGKERQAPGCRMGRQGKGNSKEVRRTSGTLLG